MNIHRLRAHPFLLIGTSSFLFFLALLLLECGPFRTADDTVAAASALAVQDLLARAPAGHEPYLAREWQIPMSDSMAPVPADILERLRAVSGLPLADDAVVRGGDEEIAVLYMFRPHVVRSDSVVVVAGWLRVTGGDGGGARGEEFLYVADCRRGCRLLGEPRASTWN